MPKEWTKIAGELNTISKMNRTPRQCREHWMNKVDPSISHEKFTREEDVLILRIYLEIGSRWHDLAKLINKELQKR